MSAARKGRTFWQWAEDVWDAAFGTPLDVVRTSDSLRAVERERNEMFRVLRLVDGLLSQGQVKEAQSQLRVALIANGRPTPRRKGQ